MCGGVGNEIPPSDWGNSVILLNIAHTLQEWEKKNASRAHLIASKLPIIFPPKKCFLSARMHKKRDKALIESS